MMLPSRRGWVLLRFLTKDLRRHLLPLTIPKPQTRRILRHRPLQRVATFVQRIVFDCMLGVGGDLLRRAEQPLVAVTGGLGQYRVGDLKFLLRLPTLNRVDVQPPTLDVVDN